jgi:hypothetical protein
MKHAILKDSVSIAISFLKSRQYWKAFTQLFAVLSTGRTGIRIVKERLTHTSKYYIRTYAEKANSEPVTTDEV